MRLNVSGRMRYQSGLQFEIRTQLGFALKDVSENLPGAFLIYKADKTDDEILYANREMIEMTGCANMEELLAYTQKSFRNPASQFLVVVVNVVEICQLGMVDHIHRTVA